MASLEMGVFVCCDAKLIHERKFKIMFAVSARGMFVLFLPRISLTSNAVFSGHLKTMLVIYQCV